VYTPDDVGTTPLGGAPDCAAPRVASAATSTIADNAIGDVVPPKTRMCITRIDSP
jgi:hypothetical protein